MVSREAVAHRFLDDSRTVDLHCWLQGDEDGGVGVQCRTCDRGGMPVVYYPGWGTSPYPEAEVPTATGVLHLYLLANAHVQQHHGQG
jgi:hypothetical protein